MNPVSALVREQAAAHRASAAEHPDDPRYARSAEALEALAAHADAGAERGAFQLRYLLEHHVVDGRFAWREGQCARSIATFGFDVPVRSEWDVEQFLMDLCDLARSDAMRHIADHEDEFERADAAAIAARYGLGVDRVHGALDVGRGVRHLYIVGIPRAHEIAPPAREELARIDGVLVAPGAVKDYGDEPPLLVKNLPAAGEDAARERVARIVAIDPAALGVTRSPRVI